MRKKPAQCRLFRCLLSTTILYYLQLEENTMNYLIDALSQISIMFIIIAVFVYGGSFLTILATQTIPRKVRQLRWNMYKLAYARRAK